MSRPMGRRYPIEVRVGEALYTRSRVDFAHGLYLPARAYDADVGRGAAQDLGLDGGVEGVAARHDADIVLGGDVDEVGDALKIYELYLLGGGEEGPVREIRPVVKRDAAEAQVREHRHELLRHVPAAEDVDAARAN